MLCYDRFCPANGISIGSAVFAQDSLVRPTHRHTQTAG